jgi:hypothetical protein
MVMKIQKFLFVGLLTAWSAHSANAAVSATEAQQLGTTLTQFGAQAAGSADGAIPAYTGGITAMTGLPPAGPTIGYPDPFASEKPLFSVTSSNMGEYSADLTAGEQALLQRYPDFRLDVYPTHRTASYPAWVLKNTVQNATTAQLIEDATSVGDGVTGAYGGIPFPIPKNGNEVMWNSALFYHPASCSAGGFEGYLVDSSGAITDLGRTVQNWLFPYYVVNATSLDGNFYKFSVIRFVTPAAEAGTFILNHFPIDYSKNNSVVTYFYSPGTRRVRLSPDFSYDTPVAAYGGAIDYDEVDLLQGRTDKFDFHLIGKREMIVPYNDYKLGGPTTISSLLGPHTLNPDGIRFERHRVWVVDATLKADQRHIYSRWTFYIDEDSWQILATESYDHADAIYRVGFAFPYQNYSQGDATTFAPPIVVYDLSKGSYAVSAVQASKTGFYSCSTTLPNLSDFTPQTLVAQAIR